MSQKRVNLKPKNSQSRTLFNLLLLAILFLMVIPPIVTRLKGEQPEVVVEKVVLDKNDFKIKNNQSIADLAARVSKSVVSITVASEGEVYGFEESSAGTGVVLSKDGYILTNKHVIDGATKIVVIDHQGEAYDKVKLVATDPLNDIAFLKIAEVDNLNPIELGDSKTIRVGQPVLAIGNSLGQYQNTVTNGIISGIGRNIVAGSGVKTEQLSDLIQTNAAINPGNSGGPLINAGGQIIGINTAIAANANNLGFAIPIGAAKGMIKQILDDKKPERAFVGVMYQELNPAEAKLKKLEVKMGALVGENGVVKDSPADKAGIEAGDVIVEIDGHQVGKIGSLSTLISEHAVGDEVEITINRKGKKIVKNLTLEKFKR